MINQFTKFGYVPKFSIARNWDDTNRDNIADRAKHMCVDVDQYRYYFPHKPTYTGAQSAVFAALRDDGTRWALVARRIAAKRVPNNAPPRLPERTTGLEQFAEEVDLLQQKLALPPDEKPTALFMNNHATKAYAIYPLGGVTLDTVFKEMPSRSNVGWMDRFSQATAPTKHPAESDRWVLRIMATQLIIECYVALRPLHAMGWAMHDLKPANMVARLGMPREVELATPLGSVQALSHFFAIDYGNAASAESLRRTGHGTCPFEAPEQVSRERTGPWSDFWAIGAVLLKELIQHPVRCRQIDQEGLVSPFNVEVQDNQEMLRRCGYIAAAYRSWYESINSYSADEELGEHFAAAFDRLKNIGDDISDLVRELMNPNVAARKKLTLQNTLGKWLDEHAQDVADANRLMGAMISQGPKQDEETRQAFARIDDDVLQELDAKMANGKAK